MVVKTIMETKAFQIRPNSPSLRATIPEGIVKTLKLLHGDTLIWDLEARDGEIVAIVRKSSAE